MQHDKLSWYETKSAQTAPLINSLWLDINDVVSTITVKEIELGVILILTKKTHWNLDFISRQTVIFIYCKPSIFSFLAKRKTT